MSLSRLRPPWTRLIPPSSSSTSLHSPFSSLASTSKLTLDHPPPAWDDLVDYEHGTAAPSGQRVGRTKQTTKLARHRLARRQHQHQQQQHQLRSSALKDVERTRPPADRTQISPYLPLLTRERNHLLAAFRQALWSRSSLPPPSSTSSTLEKKRRRQVKGKAQAWDPDAVWVALARVLRYPDEVPDLPHSHFPSSTRAPSSTSYGDESGGGAYSSLSGDSAIDSSSFFSSSRSSPPSPSFDSDLDTIDPYASEALDRPPIPLSLPELKRAFTVLASARPRTRTGFTRLLVVSELIARKKGVDVASSAREETEEDGSRPPAERGDGDDGVQKLRGGGAGLDDRDWAALILSAAAHLRTTKQQPDVNTALALFSQYLGADKTRRRRGKDGERPLSRKEVAGQRVIYNVLLHVAARARMYELFEQISTRMKQLGVPEAGRTRRDQATAVVKLVAATRRGMGVEALWGRFEAAVLDALELRQEETAEERTHRRFADELVGVAPEKDDLRPLWNALVWALGYRPGRLDDIQRLYGAMKTGEAVDLRSLRPADVDLRDSFAAAAAPPPVLLTPPRPDDKTYTFLVQTLAHQGDLPGALAVLRDIASPASSSSSADSSMAPLHLSPHHFTPIFRAFVRYGAPPSSPSSPSTLSRTLLSGEQVSAFASKRWDAPLSALLPLSSRSPRSRAPTPAPTAGEQTPYTPAALSAVFQAFLSLPAPPSSAHPALPFFGARTAPGGSSIWWVLSAFERLSSSPLEGAEVGLEAYERMRDKFDGTEARRRGWNGWRAGKRVEKRVRAWRDRVEEVRRRWEELE